MNESDPFDLNRFVKAQSKDYEGALAELHAGRKLNHWMWYIFPQFDGLGFSTTSRHYSIKNLAEAEAYLNHPVLGPRLLESSETVLVVEGQTAYEIFGSPDDLKLKSCATLFEHVAGKDSVFTKLLDRYYAGERDAKTVQLIRGKA